MFDDDVSDYIAKLSYKDDIKDFQREIMNIGLPIIKPDMLDLMRILLSMNRPKSILEIGCAVGFSSIFMTKYMDKSGKIVTIERSDVMIEQSIINFKRFGVEDKVTLLQGDATDILPSICDEFDFIFMDAAKSKYIDFLPYCLKLLKVGGLLIADDVLQKGFVAKEYTDIPRRNRTIYNNMKRFLEAVSQDESLRTTILPIADGVALCYKEREKSDKKT
jgi:predicted O-methyltransferase YrrM